MDFLSDSDDSDDENSTMKHTSRTSIIFLVDCGSHMHQIKENQTTYFNSAINAIIETIQNKIISSKSDPIGVLFFVSKTTKNDQNFSGIYTAIDLQRPGKDTIHNLKQYSDSKTFNSKVGSSTEFKLSDVLWICQLLFNKYPKTSHSLYLLTNKDHPHSNNINYQRSAKAKARVLFELDIEFNLYAWNTDGKFNFELFYKDILLTKEQEEEEQSSCFKVLSKDDNLSLVMSKRINKRSSFSIPFVIGPHLTISVKGYKFVTLHKPPLSQNIHSETGRPVLPSRAYYSTTTGEPVEREEIGKSYEYGFLNEEAEPNKVFFSSKEVSGFKPINESGITLLGFKPQSTIKLSKHVKKGCFIYPDDNVMSGSLVVFSNLLSMMNEMKKVAICRFKERKTSNPCLVALLPRLNHENYPDGFDVFFLRFQDDKRKLPMNVHFKPFSEKFIDSSEVFESYNSISDRFCSIIDALTLDDYQYKNYPNPVLQKHFINVEAIALEQNQEYEKIKAFQDFTLPDYKGIDERVGTELKQINTSIQSFQSKYAMDIQPVMNHDMDEIESQPKKKPKIEKPSIVMSVEELKDYYESDRLKTFTVVNLKSFVSMIGGKAKGTKKQDYIDVIELYFKSQ